jgi:hypothetical protein
MSRSTLVLSAVAAGASLAGIRPAVARGSLEEDLALLRLAASAELVVNAFYYRAVASRRFDRAERARLRAARFADQVHYTELVKAIGADAPSAADFELGFPEAAFRSRRSILRLGVALESELRGVYLLAAERVESPVLRKLAASAAASEAAHVGSLEELLGGDALGAPLPRASAVEAATEVFAPYWG